MNFNFLKLLGLALVITGCGDAIPEAYRGSFIESGSGAGLQLGSQSGTYKEMSGRQLEGRSYKMTFQDLQKGKSGVYFRDHPDNKNLLELFWLNPDLTTKQEAKGIQWFQAEIFYFRMDRNKSGKIDILQTIHSAEGIVSLDLPTSTWQVGWLAQSELLEFKRASK